MFLTAALAPRLDADMGFGVVSLGVAVAGFHVFSALAAPRFGRWVERVGPGRSVVLSALVAAFFAMAIAVAGRSAGAMIVLLTLAGVANGTSGPAASALLARTVPAGRRGLAFGAQQAGAPLAALLAGLGLSVAAGPLGWRATFVVAAVIALGVAACAPCAGAMGPAVAAARPVALGGSTLRTLAIAAVLASTVSTGMMAFLVAYAVDSGMTEHGTGVLLGTVSAVAMVSRVGLGLAVDRWGGDALALAGALLAAGALGCVALTAATPSLIAAGALVVGGVGWAWTGLFTLAVVRRHPDAPGRECAHEERAGTRTRPAGSRARRSPSWPRGPWPP